MKPQTLSVFAVLWVAVVPGYAAANQCGTFGGAADTGEGFADAIYAEVFGSESTTPDTGTPDPDTGAPNTADPDAPDPEAAEDQAEANARLAVQLAQRLMSAGYATDALVMLRDKLGVNQGSVDIARPDRVLETLRAYRFTAVSPLTRFSETATSSQIAAMRMRCLLSAEGLATRMIGLLEDGLGDLDRHDGNPDVGNAELSAEAVLNLISIFSRERAEIRMAMGDLYYRTVRPDDPRPGPDGRRALARSHYRQAQVDLAVAASFAQPGEQAGLRILALSLADRLTWVRTERAFGGRSFEAAVRPIGLETDDPLGFTIIGSLIRNMGELQDAADELERYIDNNQTTLRADLKNFAQTQSDSETYRYERIQALYRQLDQLAAAQNNISTQERTEISANLDSLAVLSAQDQTALTAIANSRVEAVRAFIVASTELARQMADLAALGSLEAPVQEAPPGVPANSDPLWEEDATIFGRIYGTCDQPLSPADRPGLNAVWLGSVQGSVTGFEPPDWFPAVLDELHVSFLQASREAFDGALVASPDLLADFEGLNGRFEGSLDVLKGASFGSQDQALVREWQDLIRECWQLTAQLQVERALLLNTRVELEREHFERIYKLGQEEARELAAELVRQAQEAGADAEATLADRLDQAQRDIFDAAKRQIVDQIERTERLINEAQQIIDQVISTGDNVEQAARAAEAVYSSLTAVPVGSGPGGVFLERDTLVALQDSAVEFARFTYQFIQDVGRLRTQMAEFENRLSEYRASLEALSLEETIQDITTAIETNAEQAEQEIRDILTETYESMTEARNAAAQEFQDNAEAVLRSAVTLSDSRAGLIERQLDSVFADLDRLAKARAVLVVRQRAAVDALNLEVVRVFRMAEEAERLHERYLTTQASQNEAAAERDEKRQDVLNQLRNSNRALAAQATAILAEIDTLQNGTETDNPFAGAQRLALEFLRPPPALDGDVLRHTLVVQARLDDVSADVFEFANALRFLFQDGSMLRHAVQPSSLAEAQAVQSALLEDYREGIQNAVGRPTRVVALRVDLQDALAAGRVRIEGDDPDAEPQFPVCLNDAVTSGVGSGERLRCLRIVTQVRPFRSWSIPEDRDFSGGGALDSESPRCDEGVGLLNVLQPNDATGEPLGSPGILLPANISGRSNPDACPDKQPAPIGQPSLENGGIISAPRALSTGELVYTLREEFPAQTRPMLVDIVLATPDASGGLANVPQRGPIPIGSTTDSCVLGSRIDESTLATPFQTLLDEERESRLNAVNTTFNAGDANNALKNRLEALQQDALSPEIIGTSALGHRQLIVGRGTGNTFEIPLSFDLNDQPILEHDLFVFLFFQSFNCVVVGSASAEQAVVPVQTQHDLALSSDILVDAPVARSALTLEREIALQSARADSAERLDRLDAAVSLIGALRNVQDAAEEDRNLIDSEVLDAIATDDGLAFYLDALEPTGPVVGAEIVPDFVECALDGRRFCTTSGRKEVAEFAEQSAEIPVPLANYEHLIRQALFGLGNPEDGLNGPLPDEVVGRVEELRRTMDLVRDGFLFADRSEMTQQGLMEAFAQAEERQGFMARARALLEAGVPETGPAGLVETLCADLLLSSPAFWLLTRDDGDDLSIYRDAVQIDRLAACVEGDALPQDCVSSGDKERRNSFMAADGEQKEEMREEDVLTQCFALFGADTAAERLALEMQRLANSAAQ